MLNSPFRIDHQPFFVLAGQVHNSSAYQLEDLNPAWRALDLLKANTAEIPIYWEQIEPQEGVFEFATVDQIILAARQRGLRLIFLWFGTWKNGSMQYAPAWVKNNPERFHRVMDASGNPLWVLSSHCKANFEADCKAFSALVRHIQKLDEWEQTVIALQIENEPGILGAVRDYGKEAENEFQSSIPAELISQLKSSPMDSPIRGAWEKAGAHRSGNWRLMFGEKAAEYLTAWSIAAYINRLAKAGKQIYHLPMYVNVWLGENHWQLPGGSYPSGGAVSWVVDLWKWAAPDVDLIAPDIYLQESDAYRAVCSAYQRPDNPLFVPESGGNLSNALHMFEAIADFHAVGYALFGIESLLAEDGSVRPEALEFVESFRCTAAVLHLLEKYHSTGSIYSVVQHEFSSSQLIDFGDYLGWVSFGGSPSGGWAPSDFRHKQAVRTERGRGLIIQTGAREFFLSGAGFRLFFKKKTTDRREFSRSTDRFDGPMTPYLRVEEGHFDQGGIWNVDRVRNGDEITGGIWVAADVGVVKVELLVE